MSAPSGLCGLFVLLLIFSCASEPKVKPGVYETVASWQYPSYRQYTKGQEPIGTGVSLIIKEDSTYEYASFQMNIMGHWNAIDDTLYLHCDSVRLINVLPLIEYYNSEPWDCPPESRKFVIGRNMFSKHYKHPEGINAVMILERVYINP
jgi:hypothetical protein